MNQITNITNNPNQSQTIILPDGSQFSFTMQFVDMQLGWFIYNLTYNAFQVQGMRITVNPNILYQWQNLIPFGLSCYENGNQGREPTLQQDFSSGNFNLFVLTQTECQQYAQILSGVSAWNQFTTYAEDQLAWYGNILYASLSDGNQGNVPTNTTYWAVA